LPEDQFELFCKKIGEIEVKDEGKQKSISTQVEVKTKSRETQVEVTSVNKGTQTDQKPMSMLKTGNKHKTRFTQRSSHKQVRFVDHFNSNRTRTQGKTLKL